VRLFDLIRDEDVSGVSGRGHVAEAVQFENGKVVVGFLKHTADVSSAIVYDSLDDVARVHGHGGKTRLVERTPVVHVPSATIDAPQPHKRRARGS
jgi:hypothetical protein